MFYVLLRFFIIIIIIIINFYWWNIFNLIVKCYWMVIEIALYK